MATAPYHGQPINVSYTADFFEPELDKYSALEATKQIFVQRNDSSIDPCQKVKNDNYHLGQLNRPVFVIFSAIWLVLSCI